MTEGKRVEVDPLGEMEIPGDVYYGIQTARAMANFPVSHLPNHSYLIQAYAAVKGSAALANLEVGWLERDVGEAIVRAADEVMNGALIEYFTVDRFQAGAGTSTNMNVNEVIANRALEILGHEKGRYDLVNPNDHVNMAQSTNDTFPTAMQVSVYRMTEELRAALDELTCALHGKGVEFRDVLKTGRTHLQDAMPVSLGEEFIAYGACIERVGEELGRRSRMLLEVPLGGTATGTGVNTHPEYKKRAVAHLAERTGFPVRPSPHGQEAMQSTTRMVAVSSGYKELAIELGRIANDLRLMSSGPTSGLGEIILPAVQPGSSIMPGKVNPVMPECLNQICFVVIGNDTAVSLAAGAGQFELNVMMPVMANLMLRSAEYMKNFLPVFSGSCIRGIQANEGILMERMLSNPALATLLNRRIGYLKAAEIAKESAATGRPVRDIVLDRGILNEMEISLVFDNMSLLGGHRGPGIDHYSDEEGKEQ